MELPMKPGEKTKATREDPRGTPVLVPFPGLSLLGVEGYEICSMCRYAKRLEMPKFPTIYLRKDLSGYV